MDKAWVGAIAALGGALIGASIAALQLILNHKREKQHHQDSQLTNALTFLTGNENQRSCGVSIIEGVFADKEEYSKVLVPALTSQAIYLLLHTEHSASRTEFYNWLRLMELLEKMFSSFNIVGDYYGEIGNAFLIKMEPDRTGGIDMPYSTLKIWAIKYGIDLDAEAERDEET